MSDKYKIPYLLECISNKLDKIVRHMDSKDMCDWQKLTDSEELLIDACLRGDIDRIERLIKQGANPNLTSRDGVAPLHWAVFKNRLDLVKELLDAGADINAQNNRGDTPLHTACAANFLDMIRLLLENGANTTIKNREEYTPKGTASAYLNLNAIAIIHDYVSDQSLYKLRFSEYDEDNKELLSNIINKINESCEIISKSIKV